MNESLEYFNTNSDEPGKHFGDFSQLGAVMVSKMIIVEHIKPRFMYREKRSRAEDSGWRIFTGFETEEYTDNPYNIGLYHPLTILKIDPDIAPILLKGIGSVYEKGEDNRWTRVTDFPLEDDFMLTHKLADKWALLINNLFERTVEESGDLLYTTGDKSLRITIWNDDKTKDELYAEYKTMIETRDQSASATLETFDFSDNEIVKIGYRILETDRDKIYGVIFGYSIIDREIVQTALYFDEEEDRQWALDTWKALALVK